MSYISISTDKKDFNIQGSEDYVEAIFNHVVNEVISFKYFEPENKETMNEELPSEVSEIIPAVENHSDISEEEEKDSVEDDKEEEVTQEPKVKKQFDRETRKKNDNKDLPDFYRGFMYMKCEHCGEVKGFNARNDIDTYTCSSCNKPTLLYDMVPMTAVCECGKRWRYMTNMKEDNFEVNCLTCGYPIPVYFNNRKNKYETLFEGEKRLNYKKKGKNKK